MRKDNEISGFSSFTDGYYGVYSSTAANGHGPLYNAASRIIAGGGRKTLAAAAIAGMLVNNFDANVYAEIIASGSTVTVLSNTSITGAQLLYSNTVLSVYGSSISTVLSGGGQEYLLPGGRSFFTAVYDGGTQSIYSSGIASNTAVNAGWQAIYSGGMANYAEVSSSGMHVVFGGGSSLNAVINSGGTAAIDENAYVSGLTLNEGGKVNITVNSGTFVSADYHGENLKISGGSALINGEIPSYISGGTGGGMVLNSGDIISAMGGAFLTGIEAKNGGTIKAASGGYSDHAAVSSGGLIYVEESGAANNAHIYSGGNMLVQSNGTASGTEIDNGAVQFVYMLGTDYNARVSSGGIQVILEYGIANGTEILSGGIQSVEADGQSFSAVISGGVQSINGGETISAAVYSGGSQIIESGGMAIDTIVNSGGIQILSNGTAANAIINNGGTALFQPGGNISGVSVSSGGTMAISGNNAVSGTMALNSGGNVVLMRKSSSEPVVLSIENLALNDGGIDGGTIEMTVSETDPGNSDKIIITNSITGHFILSVNSVADQSKPAAEEIPLVEYAGADVSNASFALKNGKYSFGWYEYALSEENSGYYLKSIGLNPAGKAISAAPAVVNAAIRVSLNSLQKRLGDLRGMGNSDSSNGIWGRGYYKSLTVKDSTETDMNVSGIEAGYDFRVSGAEGDGTGLYLGIMAGKTSVSGIKNKNSSSPEKEGSGSGFLGGAYLTYLSGDGCFLDLTARAGSNDFDLYSYAGGDWLLLDVARNFMAASIEAGKTFDLRSHGSGLKFEPKAEIQYMSLGSDRPVFKNGSGEIEIAGTSYTTGIVSLNASYSWQRKSGLAVQPYAEISYSSGLSGEETIAFAGKTQKYSVKDSILESVFGLNMQLSDNMYFHAAVSSEKGSKIESFGADAGIRYMFGSKK